MSAANLVEMIESSSPVEIDDDFKQQMISWLISLDDNHLLSVVRHGIAILGTRVLVDDERWRLDSGAYEIDDADEHTKKVIEMLLKSVE